MSSLAPILTKVGAVVGGLVVGGTILLWLEIAKCERPKYSVIKKLKGKSRGGASVQLRQYEPYIVAQVTIDDNMKDALNKGFVSIAGYIFGGNTEVEAMNGTNGIEPTNGNNGKDTDKDNGEKSKLKSTGSKIAMTSPVRAELLGGSKHKVSFIMPSKYSMEKLPTPHDNRIQLIQVPGQTMAVLKFSGGSPSLKRVNNKAGVLRQVLQENGYDLKSDLMLYQYHPPFWPGILRQNEVLYAVEHNE
eukprot:TRINITY_DN3373_c0_g1_i6.p2 TRINITY_DN3373_c0_g1~~TRINITY_DN3373_c0_g1_i6.p2  ORF type:complete len:246 (-),score=43.21 TRINITY_DN3373_c0_g1_i6:934-1671(-)